VDGPAALAPVTSIASSASQRSAPTEGGASPETRSEVAVAETRACSSA
jgi:hypothetical protein